jgi:hypothetical protein
MPLPTLVMPASLPMFLLGGYGADYQSPYGVVGMGTGHARKRRLVTRRPNIVNASLLLDEQQAIDWHAWYRDSLLSGERSFTARTVQEGGPLVWYEAQVISYMGEMLHLGRKRIDMRLRLISEGSVEGPAFGTFSGRAGLDVGGSGHLRVVLQFRGTAGLEVT